MKLPETDPQDYTTDDDEGWTKVEEQPKRNKGIKYWRQLLGIQRGTAISENGNESFSEDVHLVAYNIGKNVTSIQLSHWLAEKGLNVVSCDLLTKYEGARSLSYKIAIKSCDDEKATNPEIWVSGYSDVLITETQRCGREFKNCSAKHHKYRKK